MKLNLQLTETDWENINYLDPKYIWHLLNMVKERYFQLGLVIRETSYEVQIRPRLSLFSFFGPISFNEINEIYQAMIYLGNYWYLNEDKFTAETFINGITARPLTFTLKDMCEIADFDFFANPMTPGQPASYYAKFLLPMKKVLTEFKKTITNTAYGATEQNYYSYNELMPIRVQDRCFNLSNKVGKEYLKYLRNLNNWTRICKSYYDHSLQETSYLPEKVSYYYGENLGIQACAYYVEDVREYYKDGETKREEYSGWRYKEIVFKDREELVFDGYYPSGLSYDIYLYPVSNNRNWLSINNWNTYSSSEILYDYRFPLETLYKAKSRNNTSRRTNKRINSNSNRNFSKFVNYY